MIAPEPAQIRNALIGTQFSGRVLTAGRLIRHGAEIVEVARIQPTICRGTRGAGRSLVAVIDDSSGLIKGDSISGRISDVYFHGEKADLCIIPQLSNVKIMNHWKAFRWFCSRAKPSGSEFENRNEKMDCETRKGKTAELPSSPVIDGDYRVVSVRPAFLLGKGLVGRLVQRFTHHR